MGSRSIKNRPAARKKHPLTGVLTFLAVLVAFAAVGVIAGTVIVWNYTQDLPDYSELENLEASKPSTMYASDGTTVLAQFQLENRTPVSEGEISPYVLEGTVATEDERFYDHNGVDVWGIARAAVNNIAGGSLEGASTITQQLVRNTVLADEMDDISLKRKVREAVLSLALEDRYAKNEILTLYVNTINYGSGAYGIEAAAERYFSKHAIDLTLPEAALLVGIPQSPTYNNPIDYPDNALARRNLVLSRMLSNGYIQQGEYDEAVAAPLGLDVSAPKDEVRAYPYFTTYARSQLIGKYSLSEKDIMEGGLTVITTLDPALQDAAENAAAAKLSQIQRNGGPMQVAMTVIDPSTGYIKAIVGGSDYESSQVNLATGQGASGRPCGSAFKVFTLVAALEQGINPKTMVDCSSPATIDGYTLQNYDNINYGTRSIESALSVSSNTGFVRLTASIGPDKVADMAHKLGISSDLDVQGAGDTITLGVQNVTPLEMTEAYSTIASGGVHRASTPIVTITDSKGKVLVDNSDPEKRSTRVISAEVAAAAEKSMETVITGQGATGWAAALPNGQPVAGKTGTTENYKDVSFYGFTPQLTVGIWCGDPSNSSSLAVGTNVADVFSNFMKAALAGQKAQQFPKVDPPQYKPYVDQKYHIYGTGYVAKPSDSDSDKKKDESEKKSTDGEKPTDQNQSAQPGGTGTGAEGGLGGSQGGSGGQTGTGTGATPAPGAGGGSSPGGAGSSPAAPGTGSAGAAG